MHLLKIKVLDNCPNRSFVLDFYQNKVKQIVYKKDCGVDIIFPDDVNFLTNKVTKCDLGIACEFIPMGETESGPFKLCPRSSISNTPLMLANSEGIFDPEYRGPVIAALRCFIDRDHPTTVNSATYTVKKGDRLVQIVSCDMKPIRVEIVDELTNTERGSNGFGSTNGTKK